MRWTVIITGGAMLAACNVVSQPNNESLMTGTSDDPAGAEIARRANNPDFSAVDALVMNTPDSAGADTIASAKDGGPASDGVLPSTMAVVTDPETAIKVATEVSARGGDGLKTLPLSPDLLVALRRVESRGEVSNYDHDFLTGAQEPVPIRGLASTVRRTAGGLEVTSRFDRGKSGLRMLVSVWSPRGDGSWQLDDLRAEGTTLSALLASDAD